MPKHNKQKQTVKRKPLRTLHLRFLCKHDTYTHASISYVRITIMILGLGIKNQQQVHLHFIKHKCAKVTTDVRNIQTGHILPVSLTPGHLAVI